MRKFIIVILFVASSGFSQLSADTLSLGLGARYIRYLRSEYATARKKDLRITEKNDGIMEPGETISTGSTRPIYEWRFPPFWSVTYQKKYSAFDLLLSFSENRYVGTYRPGSMYVRFDSQNEFAGYGTDSFITEKDKDQNIEAGFRFEVTLFGAPLYLTPRIGRSYNQKDIQGTEFVTGSLVEDVYKEVTTGATPLHIQGAAQGFYLGFNLERNLSPNTSLYLNTILINRLRGKMEYNHRDFTYTVHEVSNNATTKQTLTIPLKHESGYNLSGCAFDLGLIHKLQDSLTLKTGYSFDFYWVRYPDYKNLAYVRNTFYYALNDDSAISTSSFEFIEPLSAPPSYNRAYSKQRGSFYVEIGKSFSWEK